MPNLIAKADGNLTDVNTWALALASTGAEQLSVTASTFATTSYVYSPTFTGTNGQEVDGILLLIDRASTAASPGTFSVALSDDNGVTATREVTVNVTDIPFEPGWFFFKFSSTLTLDGGTDYRVGVRSSLTVTVSVWRSSTAAAWVRLIRRTASPASLVAGDSFFIAGEYTAAGTFTSRSVTMDNTAATAFGDLGVGKNGTLSYGTSGSTNYLLTLASSAAGGNEIYVSGTLNIGTTASPIPRSSTAVLENNNTVEIRVADGGTFNAVGESRTSGNDSYWALLTADYRSFVFTANTTAETITMTANGCEPFVNDNIVRVSSTTTLPSPLNNTTDYYIVNANGYVCQLATALGGSPINLTSTGSGTHRIMQASFGLSVNTDTGWLDNDEIALAPTSLTPGDRESGTLNGAATATTLTVDGFTGLGGRPLNGHSGHSPVQGEVVLLTRNVQIRRGNTSTATGGEISFTDGSSGVLKWARTRNFGGSAGPGIDIRNSDVTVEYCAFTDGYSSAIEVNSGTNNPSILIKKNVAYRTNQNTGVAQFYISGIAGEVTDNIAIDGLQSNFYINGTNPKVENNRAIGTSGIQRAGFEIVGTGAAGTYKGNISHSNSGDGYEIESSLTNLVVDECVAWNNVRRGFNFISGLNVDAVLDSPVSFGNTLCNLGIGSSTQQVGSYKIIDPVFAGTVFSPTTDEIEISQNAVIEITSGQLGVAAGSGVNARVPATNGLDVTTANLFINVMMYDTVVADTNEVVGQTNLNAQSIIASMAHDSVSEFDRSWLTGGIVERDTTISNGGSPSERVTPVSASIKGTTGSRVVAVNSGAGQTVSVYVRKSATGDGTQYNGAEPRLMVKRNPAVGIASDTVLDTMTAAVGNWEQLSGVLPSASAIGAVEVYVDCDGTLGWINVDDWSVST